MAAPHPLRFLVVGTGRSGTVALAKLLTRFGMPCGHERAFRADVQDVGGALVADTDNSECSTYFGLDFSDPPVAEASYMAVPFLDDERLRECTIIHVVRDPLRVIASFLNHIGFFRCEAGALEHREEVFIYRHLPQLALLNDPASRACFYYLRWNQIIEESIGQRRYLRHRIEDPPTPLLEWLGVTPAHTVEAEPINAFSQWPARMRPAAIFPAITEAEILAGVFWKEVATMACRYGYAYPTRFQPDLNRVHAHPRASTTAATPAADDPGRGAPRLLEENYRGFNLVRYRGSVYALAQRVGPVDLSRAPDADLQDFQRAGTLFIASSRQEAKAWIDRLTGP